MIRRSALIIVRLASALLPTSLRGWGRAMAAETSAIARPASALLFALGCLGGAIREAVRFHLRHPAQAPLEYSSMPLSNKLLDRPRRLAMLGGVAATGLGLAYLTAAGAPGRYLLVNGIALGLGLLILLGLVRTPAPGRGWRGAIGLALAAALLLVSLFGVSADGATRWLSVGGVLVQPSLILLPVLVLSFVRSEGGLGLLGILLAAVALALQPDRAMAAALAAAMAALALARPSRPAVLAVCLALAAVAVTLVRADRSPAVPFVDQIFYSSFAVHPLAGVAIVAGALLMIVPAFVGWLRDPHDRAVYALFGAFWLAVILAAALGNYPTPLVGYGGSAILGYAISLAGLPPRSGLSADARRNALDSEAGADRNALLRTIAPASA